jgi:hypothetical protein
MASWSGFWNDVDRYASKIPGRDTVHKMIFGEAPNWEQNDPNSAENPNNPNNPYMKAQMGMDDIIGRLQGLKGDRLKRKDDTYALADSKFDDTRKAISALYGDPKSWKL